MTLVGDRLDRRAWLETSDHQLLGYSATETTTRAIEWHSAQLRGSEMSSFLKFGRFCRVCVLAWFAQVLS